MHVDSTPNTKSTSFFSVDSSDSSDSSNPKCQTRSAAAWLRLLSSCSMAIAFFGISAYAQNASHNTSGEEIRSVTTGQSKNDASDKQLKKTEHKHDSRVASKAETGSNSIAELKGDQPSETRPASAQKKEIPPPLPPVINTRGVRISAPNVEISDKRHIQLNLDSVRMSFMFHEDDKDSSDLVITNVQATIQSAELKGCTAGILSVVKNGRTWTVVLSVDFEQTYQTSNLGSYGSVEVDVSACVKNKKTNKTSIPTHSSINFII